MKITERTSHAQFETTIFFAQKRYKQGIRLFYSFVARSARAPACHLLLKRRRLRLCLYVVRIPVWLARSYWPELSRKPSTGHQSMSKSFAEANAFLIDWWHTRNGNNGVTSLEFDGPITISARRRLSWYEENTSKCPVNDRRRWSLLVQTNKI